MAESSKYDMNLGMRYVELNTLMKRINKRRVPEPTETERERILQLQREIRELRRGTSLEPGQGVSGTADEGDGGDG